MSMKIYGYRMSRTFRTLWMAEEVKAATGIDYQHDGRVFDGGEARELLLSKNLMGQVPVLEIDDFVLTESMAINLYLARKYDVLAPKNLEEEATCWRWSFWAMTAAEPDLLGYIKSGLGALGTEIDEDAAAAHLQSLQKPFNVLEKSLSSSSYLLGNEFSVCDLNTASVLMWAKMGGIPPETYPKLDAWMNRCLGRDAAQRVIG